MDNCALTENMKTWLKDIYLSAAVEQRSAASNYHLFALGSDSNEKATQFEELADEHREFAHILECLAKELDLD